ncbi:MAG: type II secretion system protein [Marinobacter sp.]
MTIKIARMSSGFTLVELVMVIILIGVLSVLGIGLFTRTSAFSPLLVTQQLQSATLLAQQAALAGNPFNSITIEPKAGNLEFTAGDSTFSIDSNGASIAYRHLKQPIAFTQILSAYTIGFDSMGWVETPNARESTEFRISGDTTHFACLSSLGAVYQGKCDGL